MATVALVAQALQDVTDRGPGAQRQRGRVRVGVVPLRGVLRAQHEQEALPGLDSGEIKSVSIKLRASGEVVLLNVTSMAISSRDIRRRLKEGRSIKYLLPEEVESYIISKKLYYNKPGNR